MRLPGSEKVIVGYDLGNKSAAMLRVVRKRSEHCLP